MRNQHYSHYKTKVILTAVCYNVFGQKILFFFLEIPVVGIIAISVF